MTAPTQGGRKSGPVGPHRPGTPAKDERDHTLEQRLLLMVSHLEYTRVYLEECHNQRRPAQTVEAAKALVNHVVEFTEKYAPDDAPAEGLAAALAKAGDFYTSAQQLAEQLNGSLLKSFLGLFGKKAAAPDRGELFRNVARRLVEVLEEYFAIYATWFRSPGVAGSWRETYGVFLKDLRSVADRLE